MASPQSISTRPVVSTERRYRRSAFNGSKQLKAAQAPGRRILLVLALLALGLVATVAVIIGVHLQGREASSPTPPAAIHQANH